MSLFRADGLIPVAEAYQAMGDVENAASIYALAIEEGANNPNARPRCDDLVSACLSMVREGFEPSDALIERIEEISKGLEDPW